MGSPRENVSNMPYIVQTGQGINVQRLTWWRYALTAAQCEAPGATTVHAAITMQDGVAQTITTGITNPKAPRTLSLVAGYASEVGIVTIYGTNINDDPISEAITLTGTDAVAGTKAFKTITSLRIPARTQATTPTVTIGTTDAYGLPMCLPAAPCLYATYHNGTLEATAATVTVDADEVEKNTADPNSASNADHANIFIGYFYT
jgi:hypothetical protein